MDKHIPQQPVALLLCSSISKGSPFFMVLYGIPLLAFSRVDFSTFTATRAMVLVKAVSLIFKCVC